MSRSTSTVGCNVRWGWHENHDRAAPHVSATHRIVPDISALRPLWRRDVAHAYLPPPLLRSLLWSSLAATLSSLPPRFIRRIIRQDPIQVNSPATRSSACGAARACRRSTRLSPVPCCELCSAHVGGTEHVLCVLGRGTHLAQLGWTSAELVEHARKLPSRNTAPAGLEAGLEAGIRADVRAPKRAAGLKGPRRPVPHPDACGRASNGA